MASSSNEPAPSFSDLDKDQVRHHAMALQDKSLALFDAVSTTQKALQECARQLSTIKAPNNLTSEEEIFFTTFKNLGDGLSHVAAELSNCRSQVPNASDISNDLDIALRTAQGHKQSSQAKLDAAEREVAKISAAKDQLLKKFGVKAGQNPSSSSFKLILDKTDQRLALALAKRNELVRSQAAPTGKIGSSDALDRVERADLQLRQANRSIASTTSDFIKRLTESLGVQRLSVAELAAADKPEDSQRQFLQSNLESKVGLKSRSEVDSKEVLERETCAKANLNEVCVNDISIAQTARSGPQVKNNRSSGSRDRSDSRGSSIDRDTAYSRCRSEQKPDLSRQQSALSSAPSNLARKLEFPEKSPPPGQKSLTPGCSPNLSDAEFSHRIPSTQGRVYSKQSSRADSGNKRVREVRSSPQQSHVSSEESSTEDSDLEVDKGEVEKGVLDQKDTEESDKKVVSENEMVKPPNQVTKTYDRRQNEWGNDESRDRSRTRTPTGGHHDLPYARGQSPYSRGHSPYASGRQSPYASGRGQSPYASGRQSPYASGRGQSPYASGRSGRSISVRSDMSDLRKYRLQQQGSALSSHSLGLASDHGSDKPDYTDAFGGSRRFEARESPGSS